MEMEPPGTTRYIQTLKQYCGDQIADYLWTGVLTDFHLPVSQDLKNYIYEQFQRFERPDPEQFDTINRLLQPTCVKFHGEVFREWLCDSLLAQDQVESLEIMNLRLWEVYHFDDHEGDRRRRALMAREKSVDDDDDEDDEDEEEDAENEVIHHIDMVETFEKVLSESTQKTLKHLIIAGDAMQFFPGWLDNMSKLLPNLESLNLEYCDVDDGEFPNIIKNYKKLKRLELAGTRISNILGISKMKNLEYLNIEDITFIAKKYFEDVFNLPKLRELKISGTSNYMTTLGFYCASDKVLPELRILDCSFNKMSEEQLKRIVKTHKKLEMISLLGTPLELYSASKLSGTKVKLLTLVNMTTCLDALDYYMKIRVATEDGVNRIFERMYRLLTYNVKNISTEELSRCLHVMCVDVPDEPQFQLLALKILERMAPHADRLSKNELVVLINNVQRIYLAYNHPEDKNLISYLTWQVFGQETVRYVNDKTTWQMCQLAAKALMEMTSVKSDMCHYIMIVLLQCTQYLSPARATALSEMGVVQKILSLLELNELSEDDETISSSFYDVVVQIYKPNFFEGATKHSTDKPCIEKMCSILPKLDISAKVKNKLMSSMAMIMAAEDPNAEKKLLDVDNFIFLTTQLYGRDRAVRHIVASVLASVYFVKNKCNPKVMKGKVYYDVLDDVINDLVNGFNGYHDSLSKGYLDGLEYAMIRIRLPKTEEMIIWLYNYFMENHYEPTHVEEDEDDDESEDSESGDSETEDSEFSEEQPEGFQTPIWALAQQFCKGE